MAVLKCAILPPWKSKVFSNPTANWVCTLVSARKSPCKQTWLCILQTGGQTSQHEQLTLNKPLVCWVDNITIIGFSRTAVAKPSVWAFLGIKIKSIRFVRPGNRGRGVRTSTAPWNDITNLRKRYILHDLETCSIKLWRTIGAHTRLRDNCSASISRANMWRAAVALAYMRNNCHGT